MVYISFSRKFGCFAALAGAILAAGASGCSSSVPADGSSQNESACTPREERLVARSAEPLSRSIVVDDTSLYFTGKTAIFSVPKGGGEPKKIASFTGGGTPLAADAEGVYFVDGHGNQNTVFRVRKDGTQPATKLASVRAFGGFALSDGVLYVSDLASTSSLPKAGSPAPDRILAINTASATVRELATQQCAPRGLAADGTHVYWFNGGTETAPGDPNRNGQLLRVAKAGGTPEVLLNEDRTKEGHRGIDSIFVDDASVIYTSMWLPLTGEEGPMQAASYRLPKDGRGAPAFFSKYGAVGSSGAALNAGHYVVANGSVYDVTVQNGEAKELTCGGSSFAMAVDTTYAYYIESNSVYAVPR